jgi:hypothetical protein
VLAGFGFGWVGFFAMCLVVRSLVLVLRETVMAVIMSHSGRFHNAPFVLVSGCSLRGKKLGTCQRQNGFKCRVLKDFMGKLDCIMQCFGRGRVSC